MQSFPSLAELHNHMDQNHLRLITYKEHLLKHQYRLSDLDMRHIWLLLGQYIQSGYSLTQAFALYAYSIRTLKQKVVLGQILDMLGQGRPLSEAISSFVNSADKMIIHLLKVGEESGDYRPVFQDIHDYFQWKIQWKKGIQLGLRYPIMVLLALWGCGIFMLYYLVPQLTQSPLHQESFSQTILTLSNWTTQFPILVGGAPFIIVAVFFLQPKPIQFSIKSFFLKIPGLRKLSELNTLYFFSQGMYLLLKNRMTLQKGLQIFLYTFSNGTMQKKIQKMINQNSDGVPLWKSMQDLKMYEAASLLLIKVGEETNHLSENFMLVAKRYQSQLEESSNTVKTMLEPVLIVGIGLLFLSLITSILAPIYESIGTV